MNWLHSRRMLQGVQLLCFSEMLLTTSILDANVDLPSFSIVPTDKDTKPAGIGTEEVSLHMRTQGGVTLLHVNIKTSICCRNIFITFPGSLDSPLLSLFTFPNGRLWRQHVTSSTPLLLNYKHSIHVTLNIPLPAFFSYVDCNTRK